MFSAGGEPPASGKKTTPKELNPFRLLFPYESYLPSVGMYKECGGICRLISRQTGKMKDFILAPEQVKRTFSLPSASADGERAKKIRGFSPASRAIFGTEAPFYFDVDLSPKGINIGCRWRAAGFGKKIRKS